MRATTVIVSLVLAGVLGLAQPAGAQDDDGIVSRTPEAASSDTTAPTATPDGTGSTVHFQAGWFKRIAGDELRYGDGTWLMTLDLAFSGYNGSRATWGLGLHVAFDDDSGRFGPKFLWRIPLSEDGKGYFQIAPGIYVTGSDNDRSIEMPSFFIEAELGHTNYIALAAAYEYLTHKPPSSYIDQSSDVRSAGYLGLKVGQWPGLLAVVGLAVAAGASMSSSNY